jgi:hypothetical protein
VLSPHGRGRELEIAQWQARTSTDGAGEIDDDLTGAFLGLDQARSG